MVSQVLAPRADPSLAHVLRRLEIIESRVRAAVARRKAVDPDTDDRFRGLYVSPAQVERLLSRHDPPPAPDEAAATARLEAERLADTAESGGAELRLRQLARRFELAEIDVELLLIALAPDIDARFERLYGYLQDDVSRRRASIGLGLELCGVQATSAFARSRLAAGSPLARFCLLLVEDLERPVLTRSLRVPDRVTAYLLGSDEIDPSVAALAYQPRPSPGDTSQVLARWLAAGESRLAYVREHPGASGASMALAATQPDLGSYDDHLALSAESNRPSPSPGGNEPRPSRARDAIALDLERLTPDDVVATLATLVAREAGLSGSLVIAGPVEALLARGIPAVHAFAELPGTVVLWGARGWDPNWSREVPFLCETRLPDASQRAELWRQSLNGDGARGVDLAGTMAQFRLTADQVHRATRAARMEAQAKDARLDIETLKSGARAQNAAGLERLARRIHPDVGFQDLVLPPEPREQLHELLTRAKFRERVLDTWKMGGPSSRRRGLTALFAGPSGTGKTMAAEVLAGELGLDLYAVDLATVVDKYVGETEKNLDRIFDESERVNGVILFDEADALFGKRSEVSDAHDRYANVEVAYLLQRMELFDGVAILATNLRANLDEAFTRRLDSLVDFPEPEAQYRLELWERSLGRSAPRAGDLDLEFLAEAFKLSGGAIRNIAVAAAYAAAESDRPISMRDLVRATQREYLKLGRLCVESEFGEYYELLQAN